MQIKLSIVVTKEIYIGQLSYENCMKLKKEAEKREGFFRKQKEEEKSFQMIS